MDHKGSSGWPFVPSSFSVAGANNNNASNVNTNNGWRPALINMYDCADYGLRNVAVKYRSKESCSFGKCRKN